MQSTLARHLVRVCRLGGTVKPQLGGGASRFPPKLRIEQTRSRELTVAFDILWPVLELITVHWSRKRWAIELRGVAQSG